MSAAPRAGGRPTQAEQPADHDEVLGSGQLLVHRRVLAGERYELAHLHGVGLHVVAADAGLAAVGAQQRGQDAHDGGLAGPVRAEQGEHLALAGGDIDARQRPGRPEALGQPFGLDHCGHRVSQLPSVT